MSLKIGKLDIPPGAALAPMAGVADRAFRHICMQQGAAFCVSEMVSSKGIAYHSKKSAELMEIADSERPCAVQIFGTEPETMADAARFAMQYRPEVIDINMGCPAPKIAGSGSGAALMRDPELCGRIVQAVSRAVEIPVTVKIRLGWSTDSITAPEVAKAVESAGADLIAVHGRTRQQFYSPGVSLAGIRSVKEAVSIPVIGNGDIFSAGDALRMLDETGCDGLMIARGAMGNPWIFSEILSAVNGTDFSPPTLDERLDTATAQVTRMIAERGERVGLAEGKKHLAAYVHDVRGAAEFRDRLMMTKTFEEVLPILDEIRTSVEA